MTHDIRAKRCCKPGIENETQKKCRKSIFMALSHKEIDKLVAKLRDKYREAAQTYNDRSWFSVDAFDERYKTALKRRMNLEGFILAEISAFEELKKKYEDKKNKKDIQAEQSSPTFNDKVNKIIEENNARMQKYPEIKFHDYAALEITHLYGALAYFSQNLFTVFRMLLTEISHKNKIKSFEDQLVFLAVPRGGKHPKRIDDHILVLSRAKKNELDIERDKNEYLKSCAFLMHDISGFCDDLISERNKDWETPLKFDKLYVQSESRREIIKVFSSLTGYGAILKIKEYAEDIVKDFRMEAFKPKAGVR